MNNWEEEQGSATVEFLLLSVLILIPLVYIMVAVHNLQVASYAVTAAADHAVRIDTATTNRSDDENIEAAIQETLMNYGLDPHRSSYYRSCLPGPCWNNDVDIISYTVSVDVPIPVLTDFLGTKTKIGTLKSTATAPMLEPKP